MIFVFVSLISKAPIVILDANLEVETIRKICEIAHEKGIPIWYDPTSVIKCTKVVQAEALGLLTCILINLVVFYDIFYSVAIDISPNRLELVALLEAIVGKNTLESIVDTSNLREYLQIQMPYIPFDSTAKK